MPKAMNLTFGDLLIIEIALMMYLKELDLSMQSGQYMTELLGKIEYELAQLKQATLNADPAGGLPRPNKDNPGT